MTWAGVYFTILSQFIVFAAFGVGRLGLLTSRWLSILRPQIQHNPNWPPDCCCHAHHESPLSHLALHFGDYGCTYLLTCINKALHAMLPATYKNCEICTRKDHDTYRYLEEEMDGLEQQRRLEDHRLPSCRGKGSLIFLGYRGVLNSSSFTVQGPLVKRPIHKSGMLGRGE